MSSAPDLASLEHFEREGQGHEFFSGTGTNNLDDSSSNTVTSAHLRKKRRKGDGAAIPRSRSMLSFDSFAEMDDRAAGRR